MEHPQRVFHFKHKGWTDSEVFCEQIRHFISDVKRMPQERVPLILYWHSSHTQSLATEIARKPGAVNPQHALTAASRYRRLQVTEYIHGISDHNETEGEIRTATVD
jgi:hypothetical protein